MKYKFFFIHTLYESNELINFGNYNVNAYEYMIKNIT